MATSSVSSNLGVGSGLPLTKLLEDLRKAENKSLERIQVQQQTQEARLSAYSQLKGAVETMRSSAKTLASGDQFNATKATSSSEAFTASSTNKAIAGDYSVAVTALAQAQTLYTGSAFNTRDTAVGSGGKVTFSFAGKENTTLELQGELTPEKLVQAINAKEDLGVKASLLNDGNGFRLLLTSSETGTQAAVTAIQVEGNAALGQAIGYNDGTGADPAMQLQVGTAAADAKLNINGIDITSQNNTVKDVIDGVTLNLKSTTGDSTAPKPASLSIARDNTLASTAIQNFVNTYNNLQKTIANLTAFDVEAETESVLTGDYTTRQIQTSMRQPLNTIGSGETIRSLSQIGITTDPVSGDLKLDTDKLSKALSNHGADVAALFQGEDGIAAKVENTTKQMLEDSSAGSGLFKNMEENINSNIKSLKKQYEAASLRLEDQMAVYTAQFTALDAAVTKMSSVSTYLTEQLAQLKKNTQSS